MGNGAKTTLFLPEPSKAPSRFGHLSQVERGGVTSRLLKGFFPNSQFVIDPWFFPVNLAGKGGGDRNIEDAPRRSGGDLFS